MLAESITQQEMDEHDDAMEHLNVMLLQECTSYPCCPDYLHDARRSSPSCQSSRSSSNDCVNENWRRKISEWSFEVVDHFGFDREVVAIALSYLDRCMAHKSAPTPMGSTCGVSRSEFQLIAVTSLYIAIKLHGEIDGSSGAQPRRKLKIGTFVELSRNLFSVRDLERMEMLVLSTLRWKVNPPTSVKFVSYLLLLLPRHGAYNHKIHESVVNSLFEMSRYLTELSCCVSTMSFNFKPSIVAYAAILNAMESTDPVSLPFDVRHAFIKNVAMNASLHFDSGEVLRARSTLSELCPLMSDGQGDLSEEDIAGGINKSNSNGSIDAAFLTGKTSPVCVSGVKGSFSVSSHRKRSHTEK